MNIAFYGSSDFSLAILKKLFEFHKNGKVNLKYVVSQPAKPVGRKKELKNNLVVEYCLQNEILVLTPSKIKELKENLQSSIFNLQLEKLGQVNKQTSRLDDKFLNTDISFVAAYGKILPPWLLETAKFGFVNFHGSLLPKYRGAAPVQFTILNQDIEAVGVTLIKMNEGMDTGDVVANYKLRITNYELQNMTSGELMSSLAEQSVQKLEGDFDYIFNPEKWKLEKQDDSKATFCYVADMAKDNFEVKYEDSIVEAHGKIMAANPAPLAWITILAGKPGKDFKIDLFELKINLFRSRILQENLPVRKMNTLDVYIHEKRLFLQLSDGFLEILELQPVGKSVMDAKSFINGYGKLINL